VLCDTISLQCGHLTFLAATVTTIVLAQLLSFAETIIFFFFQEGANSEIERYRTMVMGPGARCGSSDAKQQNKQRLQSG